MKENLQKTQVVASGQTNTGVVRSSNQDSLLIDNEMRLYIVADGMGGHAGGEVASALCVDMIKHHLTENKKDLSLTNSNHHRRIYETLSNAINFASTKIFDKSLENPVLKGMGTTATLLYLMDSTAFVAHVGDSRLYLMRSGCIYPITDDHSLVSEQIRAGIITEEEAQTHHLRNVITRSVGYQEEEDVDVKHFQLEDKDFIIICSDGLHGKISDREISSLVQEQATSSVSSLIDLANARGGEDNITVIITQIFTK